LEGGEKSREQPEESQGKGTFREETKRKQKESLFSKKNNREGKGTILGKLALQPGRFSPENEEAKISVSREGSAVLGTGNV